MGERRVWCGYVMRVDMSQAESDLSLWSELKVGRRRIPRCSADSAKQHSALTSYLYSPKSYFGDLFVLSLLAENAEMSSRSRSKGQPYIPSYMDTSEGAEPCVVCGDAATGLHYRCMTCEGCKGFFRRTMQKRLKYCCKGNEDCVIDKNSRNQCQKCRLIKCIQVGMAADLVLDDDQRGAKRRLIKENRERRKLEDIRAKLRATQDDNHVTDQDRHLINSITSAYCATIDKDLSYKVDASHVSWETIVTPFVQMIISFANKIPPFCNFSSGDRATLLHGCWLELLVLNITLQFDPSQSALILPSGRTIVSEQLESSATIYRLLKPLYRLAQRLSRFQLDNTEAALVAALLITAPDRNGIEDSLGIESVQDQILSAVQRYLHDSFPDDFARWPKLLITVADLRAFSNQLQPAIANNGNMSLLKELLCTK